MNKPITNPGCREGSPFENPEIQKRMAEQRAAQLAEHRLLRAREAKLRELLGEKLPEGWDEEEKALDAEGLRT